MTFRNPDCDYPTHYVAMRYTIVPDLAMGMLTLVDCANSDRPRRKHTEPLAPEMTSDCCVGIIGGADSPTAIFITGSSQSCAHTACSSLHFEPMDDVEWRMVFREKMAEDVNLILLE